VSDKRAIRPAISPDGIGLRVGFVINSPIHPWRLVVIPNSGAEPIKYFSVAPTVGVSWDVLIRGPRTAECYLR